MKNIITIAVAIFTLTLVGCTTDLAVNDESLMIMDKVVIEEIEAIDDSIKILIKNGYEDQDIWVSFTSEPQDNENNPVDLTELEVGDVVTIYFDKVMESSPLQTVALIFEIN